MKIDVSYKRAAITVAVLALFNFIFLGVEYLFDNMMTYVTDARGVVLAESYVLGASFFGFLIFPVINRIIRKNRSVVSFAGALLGIIFIFSIWQRGSYISIFMSGCIVFAVLGVFGGFVHYRVSIILDNGTHLAKFMGVAYALGIFLQFLNNNLITDDMVETIFLAVSLAVFTVLLIKTEDYMPGGNDNSIKENRENGNIKYKIKNPLLAEVAIISTVILMSCVFSTLNVSVTYVHAGGSVDIGQWPRLFLAVSGMTAGALYDIRERKYMNLIMYCVTVLSVISVVITETGGDFLIGSIVFYLSAGFFVVFFTTTFIQLSYSLRCPQLWAGGGRALNNICAALTGRLSMFLLSGGKAFILIVILILFTLISVWLCIFSKQCEMDDKKSEFSDEEKFDFFCKEFSITEREKDVLRALLLSDKNVQDIAAEISISRAVLYRHITNLNNKTNTTSRIGLLQFYYRWKK